MPVPVVSPKNWERTAIISHFATGTSLDVVRDLSFEDQLGTILENGPDFVESANENETDDATHIHSDFRRKPNNPLVREYAVTREKPHRPEVSQSTIDELEQRVMTEKPGVPARKLDFEAKLGVLLDVAERYYSTLHCQVRQKEVQET